MGYRSASTRRSTATSAVSSQAVIINTGNTPAAGSSPSFSAVGSTIASNSTISLGVTTVGQTSASTTTTVSAGPVIANVQYLDVNNAPVSGLVAVSTTTGGNILITGAGFVANSSVYVNNSLVSNTFISSTQIRAICSPASAGNVALMIFTPTLVGTINTSGVRYSGTPSWTTAAIGLQNNTAANVQLVASSDSTITYTLQAGSTLPTGMSLVSSGYISGTPTGYSNNTTVTAVIIATDQESQSSQQTVNITISVADSKFPVTTLLLTGETTVVPFTDDASANNFPLTIAGDTRPDKFSPYRGDGYYSNYIGTTAMGWQTPAASTTNIIGTATLNSSSTFTVEAWIYPLARHSGGGAALGYIFGSMAIAGSQLDWSVGPDSTGKLTVFWYNSGNNVCNSTNVIPLNTWTHIAVTINAGAISMFINGVKETLTGTTTATTTSGTPLGYVSSGGYTYAGTTWQGFNGYISNLRVVKSAWYLVNFTPSTTPLTAIANTSLLVSQSNRFIDTSSNAYALTLTGAPQVSPAIPFAANSSYATYGSAYVPTAITNYLSVPHNAATTIVSGATDSFIAECWVYFTSATASTSILDQSGVTGTTFENWSLGLDASKKFRIIWGATGAPGSQIGLLPGTTVAASGAWYHVAYVKTNADWGLFVNGVREASFNGLNTASDGTTNPLRIGSDTFSSQSINGYIADVRIYKGATAGAPYAATNTTLTIPVSPLAAVTNTQLLALQYNGGANNYGIIDNGPFNNPITRVGNTSQGSFSPYSPTGWSYYCPAASYVKFPANANYAFAGNFTIEAWVNMDITSAGPYTVFGMKSSASWFDFRYYSGNWQVSYNAGSGTNMGGTMTAGAWTHVALVRNAGVISVYVNGVSTGTTVSNATTLGYSTVVAGIGSDGIGGNQFIGYISNLRIVNGTAVYTSNFTPSTAPLAAITGTVLLTAQSNRFTDTSTQAAVATIAGTPTVQAASPFSPATATIGGSAYLDGTGDYLTVPASSVYSTTGDVTIETWVYSTSLASTNYMLDILSGATLGIGNLQLGIQATGVVRWYYDATAALTTTLTVLANSWNHIAFVRSGSTLKIYVNGVADAATATFAGLIGRADLVPYIGSSRTPANYVNGYMTDFRFTKAALYSANFSVPTAPLTNPSTVTPSSLLLNFNNGGIIDAHSTNVIESVGGAQTNQSVVKYGGSSLGPFSNASGVSNYLVMPHTPLHNMITGDFTIEFWIYPLNWTITNGFILCKDGVSGTNYPQWAIKLNGSGNILLQIGASSGATTNQVLTSTGTVALNTWSHVACVRSGTTLTTYINGTAAGTVTQTITMVGSSRPLYVNWQGSGATNDGVNAYLDDVRVTNGFARYTANFTPPAVGMLGQ